MDMKQFDKAVRGIQKMGVKFDSILHEAACFALAQLNEHGNNGPVNKLLGAINKSSRKEALYTWFNDFGMSKRNKDGTLEFASKKKLSYNDADISAVDILPIAESIPFYEYTKEIPPTSSYDVMKGVKSILARAKAMSAKGLTVEHAELLEKLAAFVPAE